MRVSIFYTLMKIHKPIPVGRPIISGCDGPTENFIVSGDTFLSSLSRQSYIKDTTVFVNFYEKTKVGKDTILVPMDVSSLFINTP